MPHGAGIAADDYGNVWAVDLNGATGQWRHVLYCCHDPPVVVFQFPDFGSFLKRYVELARQGNEDPIEQLRDDALDNFEEPDSITVEQGRQSSDPVLSAFAQALDEQCYIVDLRTGPVGYGIIWGRFGPETEWKRHDAELLFAGKAPPKKPGFLKRLFG